MVELKLTAEEVFDLKYCIEVPLAQIGEGEEETLEGRLEALLDKINEHELSKRI